LKIYTKTGDDGTTAMQDGKRISKGDLRIKAYGSVDEINAMLGIIVCNNLDEDIFDLFTKIQNDLFILGADLSNPNLSKNENRTSDEMTNFLEERIDEFDKSLPFLKNFILPGGNCSASYIHLCRAITRRAEIQVVLLAKREKINKNCIKYLNRLSDLLFIIGRTINKRKGINEKVWMP